jgi:Response regulators consisting of a CheY-like receiver domain and a winged-helix DNA-binding domain
MNNENLVIYDFKILYEILSEINNYINFKLISVDKISDLNLKDQNDYLLISNKKIKNIENQIILNNFPIDIIKLIESINVKFLKKKYSQQSDIDIGDYKLNLNSRKIFNGTKSLYLTEREANIVIYLNNSKKPVKISKLQIEVWGHNSKLETHTVETHIYRLRTKINKSFKDNNFIKSTKQGYLISV